MDEESQKIISDQMKSLPADVKEAILSVDYKTKLQEVTKRQRLLIDQAGKLEMETTLVMIGLEPLTDYVDNIERELAVPKARAQEISQDVSNNIFKPIRESLQAMNQQVEEQAKREEEAKNYDEEPPVTKFTNTNETMLNRDQILKEIEDPDMGEAVGEKVSTTPASTENNLENKMTMSQELEIRPAQELETLPGEVVKDITPKASVSTDILQAKMTNPTVISQQTVEVKPVVKLPDLEKKRPYSGVDPYREPLM